MLHEQMLGARVSRNAFLGGALLAIAAIGLGHASGARGPEAPKAVTGVGRDVGELATPCIGKDGVSLPVAVREQDITVGVADSAEADSSSLTDVCSAVDASGVVLVYASGVRIAEGSERIRRPEDRVAGDG
jgi:hypothetical protein